MRRVHRPERWLPRSPYCRCGEHLEAGACPSPEAAFERRMGAVGGEAVLSRWARAVVVLAFLGVFVLAVVVSGRTIGAP